VKLFEHRDYDHYRDAQVATNVAKLDLTWVTEEEVQFLSEYILKTMPNAHRGLCHGVRNNTESRLFEKFMGVKASILGTDISPTVVQYGGTQWDFHERNPEWEGVFDFVYSNSLDHAYDPEKAIRAWLDAIHPYGVVIIQWVKGGHEFKGVIESDCFSASLEEYKDLAGKCGSLRRVLYQYHIKRAGKSVIHWVIIGKKPEIKI